MIIAMDGPAGAGKGTTARLVASELGFAYIDTGAMYRAVALRAEQLKLTSPSALAQLAGTLPLRFGGGGTRIECDGMDFTGLIRSPEVGKWASQVAGLSEVRRHIVARQRVLAKQAEDEWGGAILEGRDIQTVVFPEAELKIFLTASDEARAQRRFLQWQNLGQSGTLEEARRDILDRDARDTSREISPLKPAPDAVHISTDGRTPQEVAAQIVALARARMGLG